MKKFLLLLLSIWIFFSCNEEIPINDSPLNNDEIVSEINDSIYYSTEIEEFELVTVTQNSYSFYMQTDTTFNFKCVYDSCKTLNLVAYCDSTGMVERIIVEDKIVNILYHNDLSKIDIFFEKDGKIEWIKDLVNPYKNNSLRSGEKDVPYSAIRVQSRLSYAVYTIINDYLVSWNKKISTLVKVFARPTLSYELRTEYITALLGEYLDITYIKKHFDTVNSVLNDYTLWVKNELYGNAIPVAQHTIERISNDSVKINCVVNNVDSLKTDFRIGIVIEYEDNVIDRPYYKHDEQDDRINGFKHEKCEMFATGDKNFLKFTSGKLSTGRKYKFRPYLSPLASSKYLSNMRCLLDYRRFNDPSDFYLYEVKANIVSNNGNEAKIRLTTEIDGYSTCNMKMGIYYGTNPDLLNSDYQVKKVEDLDVKKNIISQDIVIEGLKSNTIYYYIPYIQYDGNVVNRSVGHLTNVFTPDDYIFLGEKKSFETLISLNSISYEDDSYYYSDNYVYYNMSATISGNTSQIENMKSCGIYVYDKIQDKSYICKDGLLGDFNNTDISFKIGIDKNTYETDISKYYAESSRYSFGVYVEYKDGSFFMSKDTTCKFIYDKKPLFKYIDVEPFSVSVLGYEEQDNGEIVTKYKGVYKYSYVLEGVFWIESIQSFITNSWHFIQTGTQYSELWTPNNDEEYCILTETSKYYSNSDMYHLIYKIITTTNGEILYSENALIFGGSPIHPTISIGNICNMRSSFDDFSFMKSSTNNNISSSPCIINESIIHEESIDENIKRQRIDKLIMIKQH